MKATEIFSKTMKFCWMKLGLAMLNVVAAVILFLIFVLGIGGLGDGSGGLVFFMFLVWLSSIKVVNFLLNQYLGYLVKAGHVAVIMTAVTTGKLPDNQFEYGKNMVKQRFATTNVFFVLDKLVSGAVKQLQKVVNKLGNLIEKLPGGSTIVTFLNLFIEIALGCVDECCLGWVFYNQEQGSFKSAVDGVVIYFQNIKTLLKNALKTTIIVMVALFLVIVLFGAIITAIADGNVAVIIFGWIIGIMIAGALKSAFIDSYILTEMMTSYFKVAPQTQITFDLYGKLCGMSKKFKDLFNKGQEESPNAFTNQQPAPAVAAAAPVAGQASTGGGKFCPSCGAALPADIKFCSVCGTKV